MAKQVQTTQGLIDRDRLIVTDIVTEEDNSRAIATEWHLDGVLVRRDVAVSILRAHTLTGEQAEMA